MFQLKQNFKNLKTSTVSGPSTVKIVCKSNSIGVEASTRRPFEGNVFVKGHFHQPGCKVEGTKFREHPTRVGISVPFDNCGVRRKRSVSDLFFLFSFSCSFCGPFGIVQHSLYTRHSLCRYKGNTVCKNQNFDSQNHFF